MTQNQQKEASIIYIDLNINNKIKKTFQFSSKASAYNFFINNLPTVAFVYVYSNKACISAILYEKNSNSSKHILMKKNLTEIYLNE